MDIINFIFQHWIEWLFIIIIALLSFGYRKILLKLKEEHDKNEAIAGGETRWI